MHATEFFDQTFKTQAARFQVAGSTSNSRADVNLLFTRHLGAVDVQVSTNVGESGIYSGAPGEEGTLLVNLGNLAPSPRGEESKRVTNDDLPAGMNIAQLFALALENRLYYQAETPDGPIRGQFWARE